MIPFNDSGYPLSITAWTSPSVDTNFPLFELPISMKWASGLPGHTVLVSMTSMSLFRVATSRCFGKPLKGLVAVGTTSRSWTKACQERSAWTIRECYTTRGWISATDVDGWDAILQSLICSIGSLSVGVWSLHDGPSGRIDERNSDRVGKELWGCEKTQIATVLTNQELWLYA